MNRVIVSFVAGLLIGSATLFLASQLYLMVFVGDARDRANSQHKTVGAAEDEIELRFGRPLYLFTIAGGLMCGWWCAYAAWRSEAEAPRRAMHPTRSMGRDDRLTREEFHQVLQACLLVPLDERSPEFVRGLVVGRLAETAPGLARKVDGFSDRHMDALHSDLRDRQVRLSGGRR
jgi:hypothetical protein